MPGISAARRISEPYRQIGAWGLLVGNAAFLFLGLSGLVFVVTGWAEDFGYRSAAHFGEFAGPLALALPMVAVLLATHVNPVLPQARAIVLTALIEYGVSALLGAITFLGAFAYDLSSVRDTLEGVLWRVVWLGFLVLAGIVVIRIFLGLFPSPARQYAAYPAPTYGWPYPGQPLYPAPGQPVVAYQPGQVDPHAINPPTQELGLGATMPVPPPSAYTVPTTFVSAYPDEPGPDLVLPDPGRDAAVPAAPVPPLPVLVDSRLEDALFDTPTPDTGWPVVPPPPMPIPPTAIPVPAAPISPAAISPAGSSSPAVPAAEFDPTVRVTPITSVNGDLTQRMPPSGGSADRARPRPDDEAPGQPPVPDR